MDTFIEDLKSSVREAKESPSGTGTMVAVYGTFFMPLPLLSRCVIFACLSIKREVPVILPFLLLLLLFVTLIGHTLNLNQIVLVLLFAAFFTSSIFFRLKFHNIAIHF